MCCASSLLSMEKGGYEICRFDSGSEPVVTCIDDVEFIPYKELVPQDPAPPTAEPSPRMADHEAERSGQGGLHGMDGLCRASSSLYSKSSMVDPEVWHYESPSSASASARTTPVLLHQPAPIAQPSSLLFADSLALGLFGLQQFPASDSCPIYGYSSQGEASDPAAPAVPLPSIAATSAAADQRKSAFNFTETTHATVNDSDGNAFKLPDAGSAAFVKGNFRPFDFTLPPATTSKFTSVPSQRASTSTTTVASGSGGDQHGTFEPAHTTPNKESSIVQLLRKIIDGRRRGQQMDTYATMGIACTTT
ncbi:hypothetical protein EV182_000495 [Spiromyces aspiralis]|uniref:Uncharacterized protein n=1 Tax=Spiromyces aspiralis TaxID=68401 RepID=A0ACC1HGX9_9FUNG|nr:hypothetical protein EV182_000495 [Spiromyces aspiralis]